MFSRSILKARSVGRSFTATATASTERQFKYFDNLEIKNGVAIVRFNGPEKMNTLSAKQREESGMLGFSIISSF